MNKPLILMLAGLVLAGCSNKEADKKAILDDVMNTHEKVMAADEKLENNKMKLDTLLKQNNLAGKDTALLLSKQLTAADSIMENWMHKFNSDYKGKTDEETINYLNDQKKQIMAIDSAINVALDQSNKYLSKAAKK